MDPGKLNAMERFILKKLPESVEIDQGTLAALSEAEAECEPGGHLTLEQTRINARERHIAWKEFQQRKSNPV